MRRIALLLIALLTALPATAQTLRFIDDSGREVVLDGPAKRIVSLAPHVTELLFAAGAGDALVGVDEFSDFPPAARALPRIGRHSGLDLEAIAALRPDLVIGWASGNRMPELQRLEGLGIALYLNEIRRIDDIAASIETFGRMSGSASAAQAAADLRERAARIASRPAVDAPLTVFYQIWDRPLMTVNGEHLISQALTLCGGRNVFGNLPALAPVVGVESVLAADPQVIFAAGSTALNRDWIAHWRRWPQLAAVREGNLFEVDADIVHRPTPRFLDGVEALCAALDAARRRSGQ